MENFSALDHPTRPSTYARPERPLYPCTVLAPRYKPPCYDKQTTYALFVSDGDYATVFELCAQTERDYRAACYQGLGGDAIVDSAKHAFGVAAKTAYLDGLCALGRSPAARANCVKSERSWSGCATSSTGRTARGPSAATTARPGFRPCGRPASGRGCRPTGSCRCSPGWQPHMPNIWRRPDDGGRGQGSGRALRPGGLSRCAALGAAAYLVLGSADEDSALASVRECDGADAVSFECYEQRYMELVRVQGVAAALADLAAEQERNGYVQGVSASTHGSSGRPASFPESRSSTRRRLCAIRLLPRGHAGGDDRDWSRWRHG